MRRNSAHRIFKATTHSIATVDNLAKALGLNVSDFERIWEIPENERYKQQEIPKTSGEHRVVYNPCHSLRVVQRRINTRIFSNPYIIQWPSYLYGSIPSSLNPKDEFHSRDYIACAKMHCQAKSVLKLDIKNFFDNVHEDLVKEVFTRTLKYPDLVSDILTRICTHNSKLVQGALTSSYIAMLCLSSEEHETVRRLQRKNLTYTRFVDDITISSRSHDQDFSYAIRIIEDMLTDKDLQINNRKTEIQHASVAPLTVHGLRINFPEPRLPADEVRRIRAAVQGLETVSKERNYRQTYAYRKDFNRCMGRVNKLSRVKHGQHQKLVLRLKKILPLPSKREVDFVIAAIDRLEKIYEQKHTSYWYKKLYFHVGDRLNLVKRSFPNLVASLRSRMREIPPQYE